MRTSAAEIRDHAAATLSPETQQRLEQFLTPAPVADQAASLFTPTRQPVHILDLGSGTGILAAVAERSADGSSVVAVEQDANLAADSERTLSQVCHNTKVINASVFETLLDPVFDCVILTPSYKKISPAGSSERRNTLDSEGIETWCTSSTGPSTKSCGTCRRRDARSTRTWRTAA